MSDEINAPWTVANCGHQQHGDEFMCHRVTDAAGRILLRDVNRKTAETFASVASIREQVRALTNERDTLRDALGQVRAQAQHESARADELRGRIQDAIQDADALRAQVAALTAERDEARRQHGALVLDGSRLVSAFESERDALRARVAELEREMLGWRAMCTEAQSGRDAAQQRARELEAAMHRAMGHCGVPAEDCDACAELLTALDTK